ncbi:MAG: hypothetical protein A2675_04015 [Candidatus Yonathbacteria bacterium RIFCSPHIGHO2_01_FULL_51_10]|uniref:Uncharacterized protein n=1 Tax=Candidatus Yonathbacteria bacterium RIFCSPHIGHO2_01_FULL_51_10 TaxID=1802723 RepID=A0A1G2S4U1_9BACT|nr:MAG: hypothetical protein A2675_04015 [Candidatus Yonathbacteria bacterium RIFCSPHIGHO2_01_FULL_51_10]
MKSFFTKSVIRRPLIALVAGAGFIVLTSAIYWYLFVGVRDRAEKAAAITEAYNAEIGKDTRQTALRAALRDTKDQVAALDTHFLYADEVSDFTTSIESLGPTTGTDIIITNIGTKTAGKTDTNLMVSLTIEGSFAEMLQAVTLLENLPYNTKMNTVLMSYLGSTAQVISSDGKQSSANSSGAHWKAAVSFDITSYRTHRP